MTKITYTITMDAENQQIEKLEVLTLCAQRTAAGPADPKTAFTGRHIAFRAVYTFSDRNGVERLAVPRPAAKLLK